ncbi:hypothetical protein C2R22_05200 [Salinigranum rubrum]|uniref:DUF4013 domain-containing protein n=1 Tax=Salinigranum rubrum TaxID=755307 RepID=A0A2I8VGU1_9EURY|nr:DUF4013 domain-containing protein [Salinigranum rubrum]AUV81130.1 hypothetical protein C2R22_05200 [Salinigranum rubrum]
MALDIEATAKYPLASDDWIKTIGIGGVLTLFAVLFVPLLLVYGYLVRVLRAGMRDSPEPPVFDEWGSLLREGVMAFVVIFVYQLIPLIVFAVTVGGSIAAMATGSRAGAGLGLAGLFGGMMISGLLALVFGYFGLVGLANFAHEGTLGSAFDVAVIKDVALSREYAIPWLYGVGFVFVAGVVTSVLNVVPVLGAIVGVFVVFYAQICAFKLWGMGFSAATGVGDTPETGATVAV